MISILGDYSYTFPKPIPLKLKLKDMLEDNVDEKYYLSDSMIKCFTRETLENKSLKETLEKNKIDDTCYIDTYNKRIDKEKSGTITTGVSFRNNTFLAIKNATSKGYLEATDGDGIDISSRMEYHRGTVQKGKTQTITTKGGENNGVVVSDTLKKDLCNKLIQDGLVEEGDVVKHSYTQQILDGNKKCVEKNDGNMITLTTRGDCVGTTVKDEIGNLRIRKLTPKECFRLMGVKDEDFDKVKKNQSDASLYHLAGDSIVCNVLCHIFSQLIDN